MMRIIFSALLLLCCTSVSQATVVDSMLFEKLSLKIKQYDESYGFQGLYLHLDKTCYVKGENIWFTAYQLKPADTMENTLFVVLQRTDADTIVSVSRYIFNNSVSKGYLYLNDSLPGGSYRLLAYTNSHLAHAGRKVFQQAFTLESEFREKYSLIRTDVRLQDAGSYQVSYKLIGEDGGSANGEKLTYILSAGKQIIAKDRTKLSSSGALSIIVPAQYKDSLLQFSAWSISGIDTQKFVQSLRLDQGLKVLFYPESGHLLDGVPNKVAFEIRSRTDRPVTRAGTVLEDGKPVAKIKGNSDGRGYFTITPFYGKTYTLMLDSSGDYEYHFPEIEQKGAILSVERAVATDSLPVTIHTRAAGNRFSLVLHNYRQVFDLKEIAFPGDSCHLQLPLHNAATEGVLTLTLLDNNKKPVAERCVYLRPPERVAVQITPDSFSYRPRSKVKLKVHFRDTEGNSVKGLFSMGCAADADIKPHLLTSLPAFYYAGQYLPSTDQLIHDVNAEDTATLDLMLLTQFWTKYRWQEMLDREPDPYGPPADKVNLRFLYNDKPVTKKIYYAFSKGDDIRVFETDNSGNTDLDYKQLYGLPDQILSFVVLGSSEGKESQVQRYQLHTSFSAMDRLAGQTAGNNSSQSLQLRSGAAFVLKGKNILKEVNVVSQKQGRPRNEFVSSTCRDYVCQYNVLNCKNHLAGTTPVDGQRYLYFPLGSDPGVNGEVIYKGCKNDNVPARFLSIVNATWQHKEFYVIRYDQEQVKESQKRSTLFWSHQVVTNDDGEAELEFYTNDLTGHFTIHLQGFSSKGPVSGTAKIFVAD